MTELKKNEIIKIGTVTGAVGLNGDIKIFHNADDPEMLLALDVVIIGDVRRDIEKIRYKKKTPILSLSGVTNRNAAEELVKQDIFIEVGSLPELPENAFYIGDLIGLSVISHESGEQIGVMKNVIPGSAQDTYEIEIDGGKTILLPAVSDFIIEINIEGGAVRVLLPEGIEDIAY